MSKNSCISALWPLKYYYILNELLIYIKFKPAALENINITKSASKGTINVGIKALNTLNSKFEVTGMKRLFPYSPKFEGRHMKYGLHLWYVVTAKASVSSNSIANEYSKLQEVDVAEPVYLPAVNDGSTKPVYITKSSVREDSLFFNDPYLKKQWHYNNTGQTGGIPGMDIDLFNAWKITTGTPNVIISIHDQGVDYHHEDLKDMMWVNQAELNGVKGVDDDGNGYIDDVYGFNFSSNTGDVDIMAHGTHVAGTIAAHNGNGIGVCGVAGGSNNGDGVRIMTCEILGGQHAANIPLSYVYAADNGAVISQNSWGYTQPGEYDQAVNDAIDYFVAEAGNYVGSPMKGGVVIFAAGNSSTNEKMYPGAYPSCISVAAIDATGNRAPYSNYGLWVSLCAPGGDSDDDVTLNGQYSNGVLSTLDHNNYGYMDGTSMACPHISGVAGLVVSKYGGNGFTNSDLKTHLLTGVRDTIYAIGRNAAHPGELGTGLIDAALALANDNKIAPQKITDLQLTGVAQDFASLTWTTPSDEDDGQPLSFEVIYSKDEINDANLSYATIITIKNTKKVGEVASYEIDGLQSVTTYHFAVRAVDRWGNKSEISNILTAKTNSGPVTSFSPGKEAINITIDVARDTIGTDSVQLFNSGEGVLKWDATPHHKEATPLSVAPTLRYPKIAPDAVETPKGIMSSYVAASPSVLNNIQQDIYAEKGYVDETQPLWVMGETNTDIPNSSATRFYVDDADGFNLTNVEAFLTHDEKTGPVIMEIYEGFDISNAKLLLAQEIAQTASNMYTAIPLDEQLFFENGKYFWIVFHVPAGNKFPLGAGLELHPDDSKNCYMSLNGGKTWAPFEQLYYDNRVVWAVFAISTSAKLDQYVTLNPSSGQVAAGKDTTILATVDGNNMINGKYNANLVVYTNETGKPMIRMPVNITVTGHKSEITSTRRVNFGNILVGSSKTVSVTFNNIGLGRFKFKDPYFTFDDPQFSYVSGLSQNFEAKTSQTLTFRFDATKVGNNDCKVAMLDENGNNYNFELFAAGLEPPVVGLNPKTVAYDNLSIGDTIKGQVYLKNTGNYPLDYYMPAFADGSNMENIPQNVHKFGYSVEVDTTGSTYVWNDISATGKDITSMFSGNYRENAFQKFHMDFMFPFFGKYENYVYITKYGMLSFTPDKYFWSITPSFYKFAGNPDQYITGCSFPMLFEDAGFGKVYYKQEPDKLIVQYDDAPYYEGYEYVGDNYSVKQKVSITFQMVLYDNGNIDFFYKDQSLPKAWLKNYTLVAMEDSTTNDGLLILGAPVKEYDNRVDLDGFLYQKESAIHIKNPGLGLFANITKPYGTVMPHDSLQINYQIRTDSLSAIPYNENLVFITNDPKTNPAIHTVNFNITKGGSSEIAIDKNSIDYGTLFKGTVSGQTVLVSNNGNAIDSIKTAVFDHNYFSLEGPVPCLLKPERQAPFIVKANTEEPGDFTDTLRLTAISGRVLKVALQSKVVLGPVFNLLNASGTSDLKSVTKFLTAGNHVDVGFKINNAGNADLKVAPFNNEWASIKETIPSLTADSIFYAVQKSNLSTAVHYNWIDIQGNGGTKIDSIDPWNGKNWSEGLKMPFKFAFYGIDYDTLYIGNGLVTFTKNQNDVSYFWGGGSIPDTIQPNNYIAPLFLFGGPDWVGLYPNSGIYYRFDDDKVVVEYHDYNSNFTMGPPISFEVILYPSGNIKFQYKMPEDGGSNTVTNSGVIGIENQTGNEGVQVSYYQLVVNTDMAIGLYPARSYTIPADESKDFNMHLDAQYLVEGSYSESIPFVNNDPYKLNYKLPAKVVVTGEPKIEIPDSIEFGDLIVNPDTPSVTQSFEIKDIGTANFTLSSLSHNNGDVKVEVYAKNGNSWNWTDVASATFPVSVLAQSSMKFRATISPQTPKAIRDTLVLNTSLTPAKYSIPLRADVYNPAVISLDEDTITVYAQTEDFVTSKQRQFGNQNGGYQLNYTMDIVYQRDGAGATTAATNTNNKQSGLSNSKSDSLSAVPTALNALSGNTGNNSTAIKFNRTLAHDTATVAAHRLGYNGAQAFFTATGFVAPSNGFNLTHVEDWFIPGDWLNSKIEVMVLAGDENIYKCVTLIDDTIEHSIQEPDANGYLLTYQLSKNVEINPGETFYIVFGYEAALTYPQGCADAVNNVPGRYMFGTSVSDWYDLSDYSQFNNLGWMVRAVEANAGTDPWVVLKSADSGTLNPGATDNLNVKFTASSTKARNNYATLNIASNDISNPLRKVVLHLVKNSGPVITFPEDLSVDENDTLRFSVLVKDLEGDDFTASMNQQYDFLKLESSTDGVDQNNRKYKTLSFIYTPDYQSQGVQKFELTGTDTFNYKSDSTISVTVNNVNRWPVAISQDTLKFKTYGDYTILNIGDLFTDADNDIVRLEETSGDMDVLNLFNSGNSFLLMPQEVGVTSITFLATDAYGAQATSTIQIQVNDKTTDAAPGFSNHDFAVYPNPTKGDIHITVPENLVGKAILTIFDSQGRMVEQKSFNSISDAMISLNISDFTSGLYFVKLDTDSQTFSSKIIKQ